MAASFTTAERIITGHGCVEQLGEAAAGLGARALLVTGRQALRQAGTTDRLVELLDAAGLEVTLFERVEPEPSVGTVDLAREALTGESCDLVVAAGGGSAIDVGKAVAALARELAPTAAYYSDRPVSAENVPCIAVPTTAGTGAEVTPNSVLIDPDRSLKQSIRGPTLMPAVAIVDPDLTNSCPPDVMASAGMDALTQAIESYMSRWATPLTDSLALHAAELIWLNILAAFGNRADRPAAEAMSYGSLLAGMALANARLGAVHGMAHAVGYRYHLRHGVVCAALLPHVLWFNREAAREKYEVLHGIFAEDPASCAEWLLRRLELPGTLSAFGLSAGDFEEIAAESLTSGSLKANPRTVTQEDIHAILGCVT